MHVQMHVVVAVNFGEKNVSYSLAGPLNKGQLLA
jgi:hypothetical protein